ncbi:MAG: carboxylating nicotinate-nucleotide diphosphorylase [Ornithinimicrobium sp.]
MTLNPLPRVMLEPLVRAALLEDLGRAGDVTSDALIPATEQATFALTAREPGVIAGLDLVRLAFGLADSTGALEVTAYRSDGDRVTPGDVLATVSGSARSILTGERVALNFLGHLSGVATATATIADAIAHTTASVCCTRKTTPGLRAVEKYAVRAGGGANHRFGLDDAILVKDNHIAMAGSIATAVQRAKAAAGHLMAIEVEVDSLEQLAELLQDPVTAVLIDNFTPEMAAEAVRMVDGVMVVEASGRVNVETAPALAEAGVDIISAGWITHSAAVLDIGLDDA